jgi:hypothetical protein
MHWILVFAISTAASLGGVMLAVGWTTPAESVEDPGLGDFPTGEGIFRTFARRDAP